MTIRDRLIEVRNKLDENIEEAKEELDKLIDQMDFS